MDTHFYTKAISLSTATKTTTLFAGDHVIIADSQDNMERSIHTKNIPPKIFGMDMSPEKSQTVEFLGQERIKWKFFVGKKCLQK